MALRLRRRGLTRVRPLAGGFDAWKERGYPLETRVRASAPREPGANPAGART